MSLQDTFEALKYGPPRDDKWEDADDFSSVTTPQAQDSFDDRRPVAIADARLQAEQAYIDIQHQADADLL